MKKIKQILARIMVMLFLTAGFIYYFFPGVILNGGLTLLRISNGLEEKEVSIDDHLWSYLEGGAGETLIFLHGFGQGKDLWDKIPGDFTTAYHVIIPDLPGFGESTKIKSAHYDIISQADRLKDFMDELGIESCSLVGISMGGGIAAWYAAHFPERVNTLVLMAPFGVTSPVKSHIMEMRDKLKDENWSFSYTSAEEFDEILALLAKRPPAMPKHVKSYLASKEADVFSLHDRIFKEDLMPQEDILEKIIPLIKSPTLVIWGSEDNLFHVSSIEIFSKGNKLVTPVIFENCGHIIYMDQPENTSLTIKKFLEKK